MLDSQAGLADNFGKTALQAALESNNCTAVKLLIENEKEREISSFTPLIEAVVRGTLKRGDECLL